MAETIVQGERAIEKVSGKTVDIKDYNHVVAGYKATFARADRSEETKEHARKMLEELERSHEQSISGTDKDRDAHHVRVVAGLKAALHNEHVHQDTKEDIKKRLDEMGENYTA